MMRGIQILLSVLMGGVVATSVFGAGAATIVSTKHNLAANSSAPLRAVQEGRICIFCHTPHRAAPGKGMLWNRFDSTASYLPYQSSTMNIPVVPPNGDGSSKLCLSCHDGTVALGKVVNRANPISMVGGINPNPSGLGGYLGTDLRDDHPISFVYDSALVVLNGELNNPSSLIGNVKVDGQSRVQCVSCHDPHASDFPYFLLETQQFSALCNECHNRTGWLNSAHATSNATWNQVLPAPWLLSTFTTVAENACENCHRPHSGLTTQWILTSAFEEDVCLVCHNAHVASKNIQTDMNRVFHHVVELTAGVHDPTEDPSLPMTKHVECTDCHNAHRVQNAGSSTPPNVSAGMRYVDGVDTNGSYVSQVQYDYEVCYKCHADFPMSNPAVTREVTQNSKRVQFNLGNPSYHPIEGPGKNPNVPSLIGGLTASSIIYCTDCHASNTGPGNGGTGPAGPHGSDYEFILERNYSMLDNATENSTRYAMCYKCHSRTNILNDNSFKEHDKHIRGERTPCSACHDPHGVSATDGEDHTHLINFDLSIVTPYMGRLEFIDQGNFRGECWLRCHGKRHDGFNY